QGKNFERGGPGPGTAFLLPLPLRPQPKSLISLLPARRLPTPRPGEVRANWGKNRCCSPVVFNDIKHLARSMPADGLEAQDVVPPRCGCWVAHMAIFVAAIGFFGKTHTLARALSRCSACNHLEITAGDGHGWPLERCC